MAVAVLVALAVATGQGDLLVVVVCLIVIVMVHELGHFLAAKHGRMKVTEYFLGFGPRLWSFRRGETEYGIKALPLGGYVKIPGMTNLEEVDPADEARTYREQPFHARLLVAVAGSAMHFLMAFVLLWALFAFVGLPNANQVQIQGLVPGRERARPGPGGRRPARRHRGVRRRATVGGNIDALITAIHDHPGRPVTVVVDRDGTDHTLVVTPANGPDRPRGRGRPRHREPPRSVSSGSASAPRYERGRAAAGRRILGGRVRSTSPGRRWSASATCSRRAESPSGSTR